MREVSNELIVTTDDGSLGAKGLVTERLGELIAAGQPIDLVFAVGPAVMMRAVAESTRPHGIRTVVSLNPIMLDGTGMCGGCRVDVAGQRRFACVDGPEFDAHQVNFDLLLSRLRAFREEESRSLETASGKEPCACRSAAGRIAERKDELAAKTQRTQVS